MSMMMTDLRSAAVSQERVLGACASGFLEEAAKLDWTSVLVVATGVVAVMTLARLVNMAFGGG